MTDGPKKPAPRRPRRGPVRLVLTPEETALLFRRPGDLRWVYRNSTGRGALASATRKVGRDLFFAPDAVARILGVEKGALLAALDEASFVYDATASQRRNGEGI